MKKRHVSIIVGLLLCLSLSLAVPQAAMAAFTPACTQIGNKADVTYKVANADQAPVSSGTNTITVGNRVNLTVVTSDVSPGPSVVPNQVDVLLTFTITNNGNANQRYGLTAVELGTGSTTSVFGNLTVNDDFNAASYATGDGAGAAMTMTPMVASGATYTVTIKGTMPAPTLTNGWNAVYALRAQTYKTDGATPEAEAIGNGSINGGACLADIAFGDVAGTDDGARDGRHSARSAYHVILSNLTVTKSSKPYWDPLNLFATPKNIPGATVEYTVVITNSGGSPATAVTMSDTLPGTLLPMTASWTSTNGGSVPCTTSAVAKIDSAAWACLGSWTGQALQTIVPTLSSGATATIIYQATIN